MDHITADIWLLILSGLKVITLAIGATFVVYAFRAWLKHRTQSMLLLTIAIAILSAGLFVEGVVFWFTDGSMEAAHITEAVIALIGFSVLLSSVIVARKDRTKRVVVTQSVGGDDEMDKEG